MTRVLRFCLVLAFWGYSEGQTPVCSLDERDIEIYNAALSRLLGTVSVLVIQDETRASRDLRDAGPEIYRDFRPIWAKYLEANEATCRITFELSVFDRQVILPRERIRAYFAGENFEEGWKRFHADYSDRSAYASVSRIGFAENGQQAFLYVEYMRGWLSGSGNYVLLERVQGRWSVLRVWPTWES